MDQGNQDILRGRRERDLEKQYRSEFQQYEEWRTSQEEAPETETAETKEKPKEQPKKGFTKLDFLFLGLGFLVAILWRGCQGT